MDDAKYIGLDVHQATISAAVRDSDGKLVLEAILETKADTMLQFIHGLRGSLHVTFEEGTSADWLYTLLKPHASLMMHDDRTSVSPRLSLHRRPVFPFAEVSPRGRRSVRSRRCRAHDPARGGSRDQEGPSCPCATSTLIRGPAQVLASLALLR